MFHSLSLGALLFNHVKEMNRSNDQIGIVNEGKECFFILSQSTKVPSIINYNLREKLSEKIN